MRENLRGYDAVVGVGKLGGAVERCRVGGVVARHNLQRGLLKQRGATEDATAGVRKRERRRLLAHEYLLPTLRRSRSGKCRPRPRQAYLVPLPLQ